MSKDVEPAEAVELLSNYGAQLIAKRCEEMGIDDRDFIKIMKSLKDIAIRFDADYESLCFILMDSISGTGVMSKEQVILQIKIALENNGIAAAEDLGL